MGKGLHSSFARGGACALLLAFALAATAAAQNAPPVTVPGKVVKERTQKVMEAYRWSRSLDELKERAQKEDKLIFWLQIVGDLDGGL